MKKQFSMKNMMRCFASSMNACFAMAICLIMMGAISMVSIILLIGVAVLSVLILSVIILNVVLPFLLCKESRKCTMLVSNA